MKIRIVSFHNGNLNPLLLQKQKQVFDHFGIPLEQIKTDLPHPEAIDLFLETEEWDVLLLFDADCIPLTASIVNRSIQTCLSQESIVAASQKASHVPGSVIYASPCFFVLSKEVFAKLGKPSFMWTERGDVAEEFSYAAREKEVSLDLLYPTHVEVPRWQLTRDILFGYGTTYAGSIYHAFESNANHHSTTRFIKKCKEVLAGG